MTCKQFNFLNASYAETLARQEKEIKFLQNKNIS